MQHDRPPPHYPENRKPALLRGLRKSVSKEDRFKIAQDGCNAIASPAFDELVSMSIVRWTYFSTDTPTSEQAKSNRYERPT
jgi:hypothetical protein